MSRHSKIDPKAKFLLWFNGGSEGCDYTISCNETLDTLKADTLPEATEEARALILERAYYCRTRDGEGPVEPNAQALLIEVSNLRPINLVDLFAEEDRKQAEAEAAAQAERDQAEFERLKRKLGK